MNYTFTNLNGFDVEDAKARQDIKDSELVTKSRLYFSKIGRLNLTSYSLANYYGVQAGCYIGNGEYIIPYIKNNSAGDGTMMKVNINTGVITKTQDVANLFHANGSCIKDDKMYITQSFDDNHVDRHKITEIDTSSLLVTNIYDIDFNGMSRNETVVAIGYDPVEEEFYLIARTCFYIADTTFKVKSVVDIELPNSYGELTRQGGTFYDKYVCVLVNNENAVICYNKDGTIHHIIDIGQRQLNNFFGEIENINVYDGVMYMNCNLLYGTAKNLTIQQFFKAPLATGGLPQRLARNASFQNNAVFKVSVNKTAYNNLTDFEKFTSDGTATKPFETIAEALCYLDDEFVYEIDLGDSVDYMEDLIISNHNVIIHGIGNGIGCVKIVASKVVLDNVTIQVANYRSPILGTHSDYIMPLYITAGSTVWVSGSIGYGYTNCVASGMVYSCVIEGSTLYDGSSTSGDRTKFISNINGYKPLLVHSQVISTNATSVLNNKTNFSIYRDSGTWYTDTHLFTLTDIPGYTNNYRGFWVAVKFKSNGVELDTQYIKLDRNNLSEFIHRPDPDNNVEFGFKITYNTGNSQMRVTPWQWDPGTSAWVRDNTTQFYPFYMFDV